MNAYYQKNNRTTLVTDTNTFPCVTVGDKLISFLCALVALLTCTAAIKVEKALLCTAGFFAFFGIVGSMESGSLGFFPGILLCATVTLAEALLLKSLLQRKASSRRADQ